MATVGAKLTVPHTVSGSAVVGQGNAPELWVLYSTDDASEATPTWTDATAKLRSLSSLRGRESELQDVDAGTATLTLDNRTRLFDPVHNTSIRPMNRWWIREQFAAETQDIFKGYADSYTQDWPSPVGDATTTVQCSDEMKVLALEGLLVTSPPRGTYQEVVQSDNPSGLWGMDDVPDLLVQAPAQEAAGEPGGEPLEPVGDHREMLSRAVYFVWFDAAHRVPRRGIGGWE